MDAERVLCRLIGAAYEAAADPCQWPVFLDGFARAVQSPSVALLVQDTRKPSGSAGAILGFDPYWQRQYAEYYGGINAWLRRSPQSFQPGKVSRSDQIMSDAELKKTEYYDGFLRPQGHLYSLGSVLTEESQIMSMLTALRPSSAGAFGEPETELLRELTPHLQSALRIHARLSSLEDRLGGLTSALHQIAQGVMLLDAACRPKFMNQYANFCGPATV